MHDSEDDIDTQRADARPPALPRRDVLKRGAVIGAAVWATPVVQIVGVGIADAASGGPPPPPPPPELIGDIPSHGLFVVGYLGVKYAYQVSESGEIGSVGTGNDIKYLDGVLGAGSYVTKDIAGSPPGKTKKALGAVVLPDTTWSTLKAQTVGAVGSYLTGSTLLRAIVVTVPSTTDPVIASAYVFDGSFQQDADGDKFRAAAVVGRVLYFTKP